MVSLNNMNSLNCVSVFMAILGSLLFIVYSPNLNSELPDIFRSIFSNKLIIFGFLLLLIYLGNKNLCLSLLIV